MKKAKRKSASRWDSASEKALLEVWSEKMEELRGCRKNNHILLKMVEDLHAQGFKYTVIELKTKMHNMTARYRKEKRKIRATGCSSSEWDLFKEVELLFSSYKRYNSDGLVLDSINDTLPSSSMPVSSPMTSPYRPVDSHSPFMTADTASQPGLSNSTKGQEEKLDKLFKNLERNIEQIYKDIKNTSERVIAIEEEKKEMLKKYVDREAEVQKALIEFLKRDSNFL